MCKRTFDCLELCAQHQSDKCYNSYINLELKIDNKYVAEQRGAFFCIKCNYSTSKKKNLSQHLKQQHTFVQCTNCQRTYTYNSMQAHRYYCSTERRFRCAHCDYAAKLKNDLKAHLHTHGNEARIACPKCGKIYANKKNLSRHVRKICNKGASSIAGDRF